MSVLGHSIQFGGWQWYGDQTLINLIAASTNALNGALLARRPDHFRQYTVVGVILMALLGGIGGGVTRDVLINQVPSALTNPAYITLSVLFGYLGYKVAYGPGQLFREGFFQLMTAFSLPWYAVAAAEKAAAAGIPAIGILVLAIVGPTAGRVYIDLCSGVAPKEFIRSEWFVGTALLTGMVWITCDTAGLSTWWAAGVSVAVGFCFRLLALFRGWEEPLAAEPAGIVVHKPHVLLGRKLHDKSDEELRDLGLLVGDPPAR
ncbi:TRIC cation channel family protein [Catellatospora sp. KI3]|uniref:trimeric intracellular cation channel family protein n=1 Tax=Catellatospora sp. KI3 TaxID=3041620 RepID=UPI0024825C5C|nr:TRIC cation channel family protein [Catellatospora sp. KI3]MDI1459827.1 TRIC cation channel family protein [Catellatospora sp. KI3]